MKLSILQMPVSTRYLTIPGRWSPARSITAPNSTSSVILPWQWSFLFKSLQMVFRDSESPWSPTIDVTHFLAFLLVIRRDIFELWEYFEPHSSSLRSAARSNSGGVKSVRESVGLASLWTFFGALGAARADLSELVLLLLLFLVLLSLIEYSFLG